MWGKIKDFATTENIVKFAIAFALLLEMIFLMFCATNHPFTKIIDASESPFEIDMITNGNSLPEGMVHISINKTPVFTNGVGNVNIVNSGVNAYAQMVEIVRNDNDEFIFRSEIIPIGERCDTGKLLSSQKRGTYDCTAIFHSINDDGIEVGVAAAYIKVTIK